MNDRVFKFAVLCALGFLIGMQMSDGIRLYRIVSAVESAIGAR